MPATGLPGGDLDPAKMPGHWLLARLGKRVLRPGGRELTDWMLDRLGIGPDDDALEIAPGIGVTADKALAHEPRSYVGIERDIDAAEALSARLDGPGRRVQVASAEQIDVPDESASVAWAEAVLTMSTDSQRRRILGEVARALRPGGRFGLHELALVPEDLAADRRDAIRRDLSEAVKVGARPLTAGEWSRLVADAGLEPIETRLVPMGLLSPRQMLRDEGLRGVARIAVNALRQPVARRRVLAMRRAFRRHREEIAAIALVARRPPAIAADAHSFREQTIATPTGERGEGS